MYNVPEKQDGEKRIKRYGASERTKEESTQIFYIIVCVCVCLRSRSVVARRVNKVVRTHECGE